ncbi:hypothetical protein GOM49_14520 [Clostridium bovifaecis]|uniref:PucR family transcriptional regulator n=1 Tax=Clostridium bovifaecis TaxID=2184719 RepID=A0A6I6F6Q3_9CLOT|nr:hypothetical protein GOM49_14520 [Clostridium bovifaecis]
MGILIKELLKSKIMQNSRVLSGKEGLNKVIKRISVYDSPVRDDIIDRKILKNGDFLITSMFFQKSSGTLINDFIRMLSDAGCCGICVSNQYLKELPDEVLACANEIAFPIIQFDMSIPYADIIETTMELIITSQNYLINELRIDRLLKEKLDTTEVKNVALEVNSNFKQNNCVIYIENYKLKDGSLSIQHLLDFLNSNLDYSAFYYKKSVIIITTFSKDNLSTSKRLVKLALEEIDKYMNDYNIGVSDFHNSIGELNIAINEAIFASRNSYFFDEGASFYSEIGVNRLLIPIIGNIEMEKFYSMIIEPIVNYDKQFNSELLDTIISFVKNDGNYKKTADEFFQHQNTIRYRINKVKSLLNMEDSDIKFYQSISLAIKIANLINGIR